MNSLHIPRSSRSVLGTLTALGLGALLSACGGGGDGDKAVATPSATQSSLPPNTLVFDTDARHTPAGRHDLSTAGGVVFDDTSLLPGTTLRVVSLDAGKVGAALYFARNDPTKYLVVLVSVGTDAEVSYGCRSASFVTANPVGAVPVCNQPVQIDVAGKSFRFDRLTLVDMDTGNPDLVGGINASWEKLPVKPDDAV